MSATLEATTIDSVIDRATPEQRRYIVQKLLSRILEETQFMPQPITNAEGVTVGYFVPYYRSTKTSPPKLTPEQRAEIDRRLATLDDSVDADEFIKLLELEDSRQSK
jgi:hypothetical protein